LKGAVGVIKALPDAVFDRVGAKMVARREN
jgi:hypothetical protein